MIHPALRRRKRIFSLCLFAMLGAIMFCSKILMEVLPNIHLLGMLTMVYTLVFRTRALIPIYVYVFLNGLYAGFSSWWIAYLYIWTVLWGITMLLPRNMSRDIAAIVYPVACALHGLSFGVLYAPTHALIHGLNFAQTLAWIAGGVLADLTHMAGNFVAGLLILPLSEFLAKLVKNKI